MKNFLLTTSFFFVFLLNSFAQSPESFNYQAVVRDATGKVIADKNIGLQISIIQGDISGAAVYRETFILTPNAFGLVNLVIGSGNVTEGAFTAVDWASGPYFIETALDVDGGTSYVVMGVSQLMSVPYALHAKTVENADDADADPENETIQSVHLNGTVLEIIENGVTHSIDLSSLADAAYENGRQAGYDTGYTDGFGDGQTTGYDNGYSAGYDDGTNVGYTNGYDDGYSDGDTAGYSRGYNTGLDDGFDNGYNAGYDDGWDDGYDYAIGN